MKLGIVAVLVLAATRAHAGVTVFMEREGLTTAAGVEIPPFGGSDRVWNGVVSCVKDRFGDFAVDIVETRPSHGTYITAVVGGRASQLGYDDRSVSGVSPYTGEPIEGAVAHVFSASAGEKDAGALCSSAAHEIGHALGLDHTNYCGDLMSYYGDACGTQTFVDVYMACGERSSRTCGDGASGQNSYARLKAAVGLRRTPAPEPEPEEEAEAEDEPSGSLVDAAQADQPVWDENDEEPFDWGALIDAAQAAQAEADDTARDRHHWRHRRAMRVYLWWYLNSR